MWGITPNTPINDTIYPVASFIGVIKSYNAVINYLYHVAKSNYSHNSIVTHSFN